MAIQAVGDGGPRYHASPNSERVPPHNLEAEESVLGSMLISKDAIAEVVEVLVADDFYRPAHRTVFASILGLFGRGEAVDAVTVMEDLRRAGTLEDIGGALFIHSLSESVPTAANAGYYARIVKDTGTLRRLIDAGTRIVQLGFRTPQDTESAVDEAEQIVYQVAQGRVTDDYRSLNEVLKDALDAIERLHNDQREVTGVPTGFPELDRLTSGLQPSNLVIVAARPAVGKSTLGLDLARHASVKSAVPAVIFSLEMSRTELVHRLMCAECTVDMQRLRTGRLEDSDWQRVFRSVGKLADAPLFIDDSANTTLMEIRAKCRRLKQRHGLGLVVVDYLQLMQPGRRSENRQQEVSEMSRGLKLLAKELGVPVIAISQLSRQPEARSDKKPMLSDLRESGCLTGDTRVLRADTGAEVSLGELLLTGERDIPVWTLDDRLRLVAGTMTHVFPSGVKPVFALRLASGRQVKASANHPFLTVDGWKALEGLQVGARIAVPRLRPEAAVPALEQGFSRANPNVGTIPIEVWGMVRDRMRQRRVTTRAFQAALNMQYRGSALYKSSVGRARLGRMADVLADERLRRLAHSDVSWDEVVAVEPLGEAPVYDATVPGTHNFIADGIIAHNSLEQDADMVILIYRDEMYDQESPRKGEADFIVAKHRNGPTDTVTVTFQGQYSRFAPMAARSL